MRDFTKLGHIIYRKPKTDAVSIASLKKSLGREVTPHSVHKAKYGVFDIVREDGEKFYQLRKNTATVAKNLAEFVVMLDALINDNIVAEYDNKTALVNGSFMAFFYSSPVGCYVRKYLDNKELHIRHPEIYDNEDMQYKFIRDFSSRFFKDNMRLLKLLFDDFGVRRLTNDEVRKDFGVKHIDCGVYLIVDKQKYAEFKEHVYIKHIFKHDIALYKDTKQIYCAFRAFTEIVDDKYYNSVTLRERFNNVIIANAHHRKMGNVDKIVSMHDYCYVIKNKEELDEKARQKKNEKMRIANMALTDVDKEREARHVKNRTFLKSLRNTLRLTSAYSCVPKIERHINYGEYNEVDIHAAMPRLAYMISHEDFSLYTGDFYKDIAAIVKRDKVSSNFKGDVRKRFKDEVVKCMNVPNGYHNGKILYDREQLYKDNLKKGIKMNIEFIKRQKIIRALFEELNIKYDGTLDNCLKFSNSVFAAVQKVCKNRKYGWLYNILESKINLYIADHAKEEIIFNFDAYATKNMSADEIVELYNKAVQEIVNEAKVENKPLNLDQAKHYALCEPNLIDKTRLTVDDDIETFKKYKDKTVVVIRQYKDYSVAMCTYDNRYYAIKGSAKTLREMMLAMYDVDVVLATNLRKAEKPMKNFIYSIQCKNIAKDMHDGLYNEANHSNLDILDY